MLNWYDLNVYNDAGLITRQLPSILYTWELKVGVQFTYTPFAALVFAGGSLLPLLGAPLDHDHGQPDLDPADRLADARGDGPARRGPAAAALAVSALALWTEPVVKAMFLGQIEPLLMLLVVWDLTRNDPRRWKGVGIGIAAGIKLVPLLFIPYLLLPGSSGRRRSRPARSRPPSRSASSPCLEPSASYWLTGYFMRPGRTGGVALAGQPVAARRVRPPVRHRRSAPRRSGCRLPLVVAVARPGRRCHAEQGGRPVQGWTLVGITSVLVSPISWDHHWVWIVPFIALLAGVAITARPLARAGCIARDRRYGRRDGLLAVEVQRAAGLRAAPRACSAGS